MSSILTGSISLTFVPVAQRIRHLTTNQGIVGSNPTGDVFYNKFIHSVFLNSILKNAMFTLDLNIKCIYRAKSKKVPPPGFEPGSHG